MRPRSCDAAVWAQPMGENNMFGVLKATRIVHLEQRCHDSAIWVWGAAPAPGALRGRRPSVRAHRSIVRAGLLNYDRDTGGYDRYTTGLRQAYDRPTTAMTVTDPVSRNTNDRATRQGYDSGLYDRATPTTGLRQGYDRATTGYDRLRQL